MEIIMVLVFVLIVYALLVFLVVITSKGDCYYCGERLTDETYTLDDGKGTCGSIFCCRELP